MNILVAMDSFKGSLSSQEANACIQQAFEEEGHHVITQAVADGGEGSVASFIDQGAERVMLPTVDSLRRPIMAEVAYLPDTDLVVIEVAQASGIQFVTDDENTHPPYTSSFGTGKLIMEAIQQLHVKNVLLMLGGTGVIDGGIGMGEALGIRYYAGDTLLEQVSGKDLATITKIDTSTLRNFDDIQFFIGHDVVAPLTGENGAVYGFGKQKGLSESQMPQYEDAMTHYRSLLTDNEEEGDGAAGGIGFFCRVMLNATAKSGFDYIWEHSPVAKQLDEIELVVTGEGQCDHQTWLGKLPMQLICHTHKPTLILTGQNHTTLEDAPKEVVAIFPIIQSLVTTKEAIHNGKPWLYQTAKQLARLLTINHLYY